MPRVICMQKNVEISRGMWVFLLTNIRIAYIIKTESEGQRNLKKGEKPMVDLEPLIRAIKNLRDTVEKLTEVLSELISKL